jgi:predicted O-methyltransferase YrrM
VDFAEEYRRRRNGPWTDIQDHLPFLYDTVRAYNSPDVVELGTRSGESTSAFLAALEAGGGGHLYSVDIDEPQVPAEWFTSSLWTFHQGDDLALADVLPPQFDVLFIDTSHTYEQTFAELQTFVPRVAVGGVVLLHDTQWLPPSVSLLKPGGPVTEALNVFCAETGLDWENRLSGPGWYGMGIIRITG